MLPGGSGETIGTFQIKDSTDSAANHKAVELKRNSKGPHFFAEDSFPGKQMEKRSVNGNENRSQILHKNGKYKAAG